jgi:hypothetical protein
MGSIAQLCVRPGVYFAAVQGEGVIMDLIEDRYYGLCAQSTALWQRLLEGQLPDSPLISHAAVSPEIVAQQLDAWRQTNLVIDRARRSSIADLLPVLKQVGARATGGLSDARIDAQPFSWFAFLHLLRGARWSRRTMKRRGICWTLKRLQQIPVSAQQQPEHAEAIVHRVMRVYRSSRQVLNQGKDDCLPRSLALVVALRRLGVDAEICFGVLKFPFAAHAWVEAGGRVINEAPESVQHYTLLARF